MRLAEYMKANNITDAALAAYLGMSEGAVRKWRWGQRIPRREIMAQIQEYTAGAVTPIDFATHYYEKPAA